MTESDDVRVPQDIPAERAILGSAMLAPGALRDVLGSLNVEDFYWPSHAVIWSAIMRLVERSEPVDALTVAGELGRTADVARVGGLPYLHTLVSSVPTATNVGYYVPLVTDTAARRRLITAGTRIVQRAEAGTGEIADMLTTAASDVAAVRDTKAGVELLTTTVDEFLTQHVAEPDWVVPGLLARGDRFVLTGSGGIGKSTLLRQIAVCAAAGLPPLDWHTTDPFDPVRVTMIDCENSDHQLQTLLWGMRKEASDNGTPVEDRLRVGGHGNPLNLLDPASALSLLRTVEHDKPDLVYIGPVYKLHNDDPDKEIVVKKITGVLDKIRETGCALITEAHHAKQSQNRRTLEPAGSNLWTWWPEFGRGLRMDPDTDTQVRRTALEPWRLDRVQRKWPSWIEAGGRWPWARCADNEYIGWAGKAAS